MALLGRDGILELSREWPDALALSPEAVNSNGSITILDQAFWAGDRIILAAADGIPIDFNGDGYADCPEGHGIYRGSIYTLGPARNFYTGAETNENGPHYQATDGVPYYNTAATTGLTTSFDGYMSRDLLDRVLFFGSAVSAFNGAGSDQYILGKVKVANFVVAPYFNSTPYRNGVVDAANTIKQLTLPSNEQPLKAVITVPSILTTTAADPANRGWLFQAYLQGWALNVDASSLDMTAIGETFGEATKALVKGSGSMNFVFEHIAQLAAQDPLVLLQLVLLTQQGSKATAKFYLMKDRTGGCEALSGTIYYLCDILLTGTSLDMRADSLVSGSTEFVVTGTIKLEIES